MQVWPKEQIGIRLSPVATYHSMHDDNPMATFLALINALNQRDILYIHCVEATERATRPSRETFDFLLLRQAFNGLYIANNCYTKTLATTSLNNHDADLICFNNPSTIIDQFIKYEFDASILSVKSNKPHSDSCFYSINTTKTHNILKEYEYQYTKEIFNKDLYPKPYDAPVWSRTLDILKNEIKVWDFNIDSDAKSPLKDTILNNYFRHLKANQKDSGRLLGLIDKTINAIDKNKSIEEILLRFDRKLRQDDSKKLEVPY